MPATREFLLKVVEILIDYIKEENDRSSKVLDFHHPEKMKTLLDLDVPDQGVSLQQLVKDCAVTLKYQVRTGLWRCLPVCLSACQSHQTSFIYLPTEPPLLIKTFSLFCQSLTWWLPSATCRKEP
ncbi:Glutamate decarboxylase [Homalodisca vitripennis]|nr:Glutamate decarboxylase [Homalodisca vitripennis]